MSEKAIVSVLFSYARQRRAIGSFSAIAELLVNIYVVCLYCTAERKELCPMGPGYGPDGMGK